MLRVSTNQVDQWMAQGHAHAAAGNFAGAEAAFKNALASHAAHAPAWEALGLLYARTGRRNESAAALQRALLIAPTPEAFLHLGQLLTLGGLRKEGVNVMRDAAVAFPNDFRIAAELGRALEHNGQLDDAVDVLDAALQRWPGHPLLVFYLGGVLFQLGRLDRAVSLYRDCISRHPAEEVIHSALLFTLHFVPGVSAQDLLREHRAWDAAHASSLQAQVQPFGNRHDPERRLRVGYVSPDFRNHGVGRFIAPILAHHDRASFEIFAYSDMPMPDAFTERIKSHVDHWRPTHGMNHARLAEAIRADGIDILVDLTMHMPANRMPAFARKPAPIQVTYLAYCSTTGLSKMDYRLSDPRLDPAGWDDRYSEKTIRLAQSWWLYEAPEQAPAVTARKPGTPILFGSMNNYAKVSEAAAAAWVEILRRVPESRFLLHCPEGKVRSELVTAFGEKGISADRLEFAARSSLAEYFATYQRIDVALDSFPYAGGTTTCDALWMGVPVVTLGGDQAVGRGGVSLLSNLGLPELIAPTKEAYIETAVALANSAPRLSALRETLRERMRGSPIMDGVGFIQGMEGALRNMWREWCAAK